MKRFLVLVAALAAISTAAGAQDTRPDVVACRDSNVTGMYRRCALWIDGTRIRRGEAGTVVTRKIFLMPPRLSQHVAGDSALAYASLFERRSKESTALFLAGGILFGLSVLNADCSGEYRGCAYDYGFDSPAFTLLVGGVVLGGIGEHFQLRAARAGARAVWWNNARFAR